MVRPAFTRAVAETIRALCVAVTLARLLPPTEGMGKEMSKNSSQERETWGSEKEAVRILGSGPHRRCCTAVRSPNRSAFGADNGAGKPTAKDVLYCGPHAAVVNAKRLAQLLIRDPVKYGAEGLAGCQLQPKLVQQSAFHALHARNPRAQRHQKAARSPAGDPHSQINDRNSSINNNNKESQDQEREQEQEGPIAPTLVPGALPRQCSPAWCEGAPGCPAAGSHENEALCGVGHAGIPRQRKSERMERRSWRCSGLSGPARRWLTFG